ncbi:MAG: hypothetical protein ACP5KP_03945, partial [Candidatus Micrarchaeia archaeon]
MRIVFFLLILANLFFSQPLCPSCEELFSAPETGLIAGLMDKTVNVYVYALYDGKRLPVGNATLFMEVYNASGDLYSRCRGFTDENGKAVFDISQYTELCGGEGILRGCTIGIKFCCSSSPNCLLQACLNKSIQSFEDVPPCSGVRPGYWPDSAYINNSGIPVFTTLYPSYAEVVYTSTLLPPLSGGTAPAICLPLFIIVGMLLAGAYATGQNPFFWFDLNTLRFTRGQRARVTGKGGFTLQQTALAKHAKALGGKALELGKKVPVVKGAIEKVEKGVKATTEAAAKPIRKVGEMAVKILPAGIKEGVIRGAGESTVPAQMRWMKKFKPATWMKEREEQLRGLGRGAFAPRRVTGKGLSGETEVSQYGTGERRAGAERIAIETKQFGGEQILSAVLMAGFAKGNVAALAKFFGVPEAIMRELKAGAAKEQLEYLTKNPEK